MKRLLPLMLLCACPAPPSSGGGGGGGAGGSGTGGGDGTPQSWQWLPISGSVCGSGSTAGIGLSAASADELFIFMQGGGACWNTGTCVPSLLAYGPVCYYGMNVCLVDDVGGTKPTAVHVTEKDPYPADGGGAFPSELATIAASKALDRNASDNPFRAATFVFVPYCTGDLHSGATTHTYQYKYGAFDQPSSYVMHFAGASNMDAYLAELKKRYPSPKRVWLTGSSAGGYGATFNFDRVARAWPQADVELLADSAPFLETGHFAEWRDAWAMQFPTGCTECFDGGLPAVTEHLSAAYPDRRLGLLSNDHDKVIAWYFFGATGPDAVLNPPVGAFNTALLALEGRYDAHANTRYFVVPGDSHVLWGGYGLRLNDGGYSPPLPSRDGGTDEKVWIDAWADGGAAWENSP